MSIMRCEKCERMVDTDFEEVFDAGNPDWPAGNEKWVCESCADMLEDQREQDEHMRESYLADLEVWDR